MALEPSAIEAFAREGESLRLEFKSEVRGSLADRLVYETVVCLANSEGGVLLIGIEDSGKVSGARPRHESTTDPFRLQAAILINTRISVPVVAGHPVVAIEVDPYPEICATRDGKSLRRVMGIQGPECVPFYPHEHVGRRSDLG